MREGGVIMLCWFCVNATHGGMLKGHHSRLAHTRKIVFEVI